MKIYTKPIEQIEIEWKMSYGDASIEKIERVSRRIHDVPVGAALMSREDAVALWEKMKPADRSKVENFILRETPNEGENYAVMYDIKCMFEVGTR